MGPWLGIWVTSVFTPLRPNTPESEILAVSFHSFLKIKVEKSGLCTAPGVPGFMKCDWAIAASVLRLCRREVLGGLGGGAPGPGWAEATLVGQEVTEAQGGRTCLRPPCE